MSDPKHELEKKVEIKFYFYALNVKFICLNHLIKN